MKRILTVLLSAGAQCEQPLGEDYEILEIAEGDELKAVLKRASGKFTIIFDRTFTLKDTQTFLGELGGCDADVVAFDGGFCFKTQFLKSMRRFDTGTVQIIAIISAKSAYKTQTKPFEFANQPQVYSENEQNALKSAVEEFGKEKHKLPHEVYSLAFETLLLKLTCFYMAAMLAIRKKKIDDENLINFDLELKQNIVLYLALEKRFTVASLAKLRKNKFKLPYFTAKKFKKLLKKNNSLL